MLDFERRGASGDVLLHNKSRRIVVVLSSSVSRMTVAARDGGAHSLSFCSAESEGESESEGASAFAPSDCGEICNSATPCEAH